MIFALKGLRQICGVQGSMASGCALARPPAGFLTLHKKTGQNPVFHLAEGEGFEPPEALTSTVFKTAAIDRSANLPYIAAVSAPAGAVTFLFYHSV